MEQNITRDRTPAADSGLAKKAVQRFAETLVPGSALVLHMKLVLKIATFAVAF
jgi:hypothetical protein